MDVKHNFKQLSSGRRHGITSSLPGAPSIVITRLYQFFKRRADDATLIFVGHAEIRRQISEMGVLPEDIGAEAVYCSDLRFQAERGCRLRCRLSGSSTGVPDISSVSLPAVRWLRRALRYYQEFVISRGVTVRDVSSRRSTKTFVLPEPAANEDRPSPRVRRRDSGRVSDNVLPLMLQPPLQSAPRSRRHQALSGSAFCPRLSR